MATLNQIKVNTGTEDSPSYVLHDVHDKRLDDGASSLVTTCTHLLATNAALSSFNPITSANLASVLGVGRNDGVESTNWFRIARVDRYNSGLLFCCDGFNNHPGGSYIIAFCQSYLGFNAKYIFKTTASETDEDIRLNQLRVVESDNMYYLEGKRINDRGVTSVTAFGHNVYYTPAIDSPGGTVVAETTISE